MFALSMGLVKLGQPQPDSYLFGRYKQRLARDDVNVNAWFLVVEIFASARALGATLLRHAILFRKKVLRWPRESFHTCSLLSPSVMCLMWRSVLSNRTRGVESSETWRRSLAEIAESINNLVSVRAQEYVGTECDINIARPRPSIDFDQYRCSRQRW